MVIRKKEDSELSTATSPVSFGSGRDRVGMVLEPWIKRRCLLLNGHETDCIEVVSAARNQPTAAQMELDFYRPLLDAATQDGSPRVIALGVTPQFSNILEQLGFTENGQLVRRRRYLGVGSITRHSKLGSLGMRSIARVSRQIRRRMLEAQLGDESFRTASEMFMNIKDRLDVVFDRGFEELSNSYEGLSDNRCILFLRRKVGLAMSSYVIFREHEDSRGRHVLSLEDYWTADLTYRSMLWLMGEISLWALAVGFDVIDNFALKGSYSDQCFMALGGIRKKETVPIYERSSGTTPKLDLSSGHIRFSDFTLDSPGDK